MPMNHKPVRWIVQASNLLLGRNKRRARRTPTTARSSSRARPEVVQVRLPERRSRLRRLHHRSSRPPAHHLVRRGGRGHHRRGRPRYDAGGGRTAVRRASAPHPIKMLRDNDSLYIARNTHIFASRISLKPFFTEKEPAEHSSATRRCGTSKPPSAYLVARSRTTTRTTRTRGGRCAR